MPDWVAALRYFGNEDPHFVLAAASLDDLNPGAIAFGKLMDARAIEKGVRPLVGDTQFWHVHSGVVKAIAAYVNTPGATFKELLVEANKHRF